MTQIGGSRKIWQENENGRSFETYEALHKFCTRNGTSKIDEYKYSATQLTTGSAVEVSVKAAQTISLIGKVGLTIVGALSANTAAWRSGGSIVTLVYKNNEGTIKTATWTGAADATTEVAFKIAGAAVTDFYCAISMTSSIPTAGADTFGMGTTGALTMCVIQTTTNVAVAADIKGVGLLYAWDSANTAADRGLVLTLEYLTPWGEEKYVTATLAADASTAVRFIASDGVYISDFYRIHTLRTTALVGTYCAVGVVGKGTIYGVIEAAYYESVHTRFMALGEAYGESYLGKIIASFPILDGAMTIALTYTPYGYTLPMTISVDILASAPANYEICERLAPLSEVSMTIIDAATAGNAHIEEYLIDVYA